MSLSECKMTNGGGEHSPKSPQQQGQGGDLTEKVDASLFSKLTSMGGTGDRIRTNDTPGMKHQIWGQISGNYPIK